MSEVITSTSITKPHNGKPEKSNALSVMNVLRMTMATFTKLLAIRMVASSLLGLSNNFSMRREVLPFFCFIVLSSDGPIEKKAISDPDINPEKSNRIRMDNRAGNNENVNPVKKVAANMMKSYKWGKVSGSSKMY